MKRPALLLTAPVLLALAACSSSSPPPAASPGGGSTEGVGPVSTPFILPGIKDPETVPADKANLPDDEEVIGVVVNGQARAYRLAALKPIRGHVVNDVVNKSAVTVTYCDRADCVRTFTVADRDLPLPVMLGGYREGMLLRIDDAFYVQKTGKTMAGDREAPYPAMPFKRVKWGEWKKAHPMTDVYLGFDEAGDPADPPAKKP